MAPMAPIFTRIIEGELPARFAWKDEECVAFLSINPLRAGPVLVEPGTRLTNGSTSTKS